MSLILQAVAAHAAVAGHLTVHPVTRFLAAGGKPAPAPPAVPDPPVQVPPGLKTPINTILGWGKYLVLASGVAGLLICGGKMTIGHRNRASFAADGATGIPWVLAGLSVAAVAAAIVGVFL
jgi:hypothetical protein